VSALAQKWQALEVIAVDDCSSDDSWAVLSKAAEQEPRLKIFRHDVNRGYPSALNTILENASGEFLAIFDDDDDSVPDRLEAQIQRLSAYEESTGAKLVLCYSNRAVVTIGGTTPDHIAEAIGRAHPEPHGMEVADFVLAISEAPNRVWGMFGSCTLIARRSTFIAIGPFDPDFRRCAELDLAVRAAQMGAHFISVNRPLVTQYKTESADKSGTKPLRYALMLRKKHREYLERKRLYHASRLFARSNFWGDRKQKFKSRLYRGLAFALAPRLLKAYLEQRFGQNTSRG
jgi:glycosyltransferase involved in cell wall biosynthesis